MGKKLNQIVAIESGVKSRACAKLSEIYKTVQQEKLFFGMQRKYSPVEDGGEQLPPENQKVQQTCDGLLKKACASLNELFNVTFMKDTANCSAKADIEVDGTVLLTDVPVTTLLFLEKQLNDLHTLVSKLPTLDSSEDWSYDTNLNLYKTEPTTTIRTRKAQRPLVLYPATPEHPAQTQLITEDIVAGKWEQTKFTGAISETKKERFLARIEKLQKAVKSAREEANSIEVNEGSVGTLLLYIFEC